MKSCDKDWSTSTYIIAIFLIIILLAFSANWMGKRNHTNIHNWSQQHGYVATNIQQWYWSTPFCGLKGWLWRRKGDAIYQADLVRNGVTKLSYFRCSSWGTIAQKWEDGTTDDE